MKEIMSKFIPGLVLAESFYHEIVQPILARRFPGLNHSAGKLHGGSDVLGFDTPQSMDHGWGPAKMDLFLSEDDCEQLEQDIKKVLADELPHEYRGLPVDFLTPEIDGGTIGFVASGPVSHRISVTTVAHFFRGYIGLNPLDGISEIEWLLIAPQYLRTIASGKIFHDGLNQLKGIQERLRWYPKDIWLYLLSCQWRKIDQEESFMARCGDVGDALGSRVVAARMVDELMRLCFLMERQYWPYYKWFGSAFSKLECARSLTPIFHSIFTSQNWKEREGYLSSAYLRVAEMHNHLGVTEYIEPTIGHFYSRPYQVLHSERFAEALYSKIDSEAVLSLPRHVGGIAQYVDSTDVLDRIDRCKQLKVLYERNVQQPDARDGL
jgi:Domain of unknown function (DUF4037)